MSTSSSGSSSTLSGLRLSGTSLLSGLDTEAIVKQMASATKSKINKQQQKSDSLAWKQTSYQSVISKISTFKSTYFNSLNSETNIGSNTLMGAYKATSSNTNVAVSASSSASATTYTITDIAQLAENAEISSDFDGGSLSEGIMLDFSSAVSGTTYNIKLSLDGTAKDITFVGGADTTATSEAFIAAVQTALGTTEGPKFTMTDGSLVYNSTDEIVHTFNITSSTKDTTSALKTASLTAIGLPAGGSSQLATSTKLSGINFTTPLTGGSYSFNINGADFTFDSSATIKEIMTEVNASTEANVTMSFNSLSQAFSLKSDDEGASSSIEMTQTSGNLLTSLFGSSVITSGKELGSTVLMDDSITGTALDTTDLTDNRNTKITISINGGEAKEIGLWGYDSNGEAYDYTDTTTDGVTTTGASKAVAALNTELTRVFGTDAPSFTYNGTTKQITLSANTSGDIIEIGAVSGSTTSTALLSKLGFGTAATQTNAISADSKLSDLLGSDFTAGSITIGTKSMDITTDTTLAEIQTEFGTDNVSVDYTTGTISAKAQVSSTTVDDTDAENLISKLFNGTYDDINTYTGTMTASTGTADIVNGQNAIITINGAQITSASNNLTIDGTSINIGNLTTDAVDAVSDSAPITISTVRDNTDAKAAIVKFVEDYNTLIDELYTEIETKRPTDDGTTSGTKYDPLTEEQREEMSDDEITAWEKKAKTGLLYNDSSISAFLSKIRSVMTTTTSSGYPIYEMGFSISSVTSDHGKITIDEDALDAAFESNPEDIQELFTDSTNGLAAKMTAAIDSAISTSRTSGYGSLVRIAGIESTASATTSEISTKITAYQTSISDLEEKYTDEMERYWAKFTALETATAKYSSYSSLFTSST